MEESNTVWIIILAFCLHLVVVYLGYRFHLWMLDKTSSSNRNSSWSTWWNKNTTTDDTANLSHPQLAFLQTLCLWLLVVGLIGRWRPEILLIVFVGLILLMRNYPNDGGLPENQVYVAVLGYIAWLAVLATTTALLLWPCTTRWDMGKLEPTSYQKMTIGGAIASSAVSALALIAFCIQRPQVIQDTGNCMGSSLV